MAWAGWIGKGNWKWLHCNKHFAHGMGMQKKQEMRRTNAGENYYAHQNSIRKSEFTQIPWYSICISIVKGRESSGQNPEQTLIFFHHTQRYYCM